LIFYFLLTGEIRAKQNYQLKCSSNSLEAGGLKMT